MESLNQTILRFWKEHVRGEVGGVEELPPLLYPEFRRGGTLVVGFNPSFAPSERDEVRETWRSLANADEPAQIRKLAHLQAMAHKRHRHFTESDDVLNRLRGVPGPLQYYDLFPLRESRQALLTQRIRTGGLGERVRKAGCAWFRRIIQDLRPKLVWIANKGAWRIIRVDLQVASFEEVPIKKGRVYYVPELMAGIPAVVTNPLGLRYPQYRHTDADLAKLIDRFRRGPAG